MKFIRYRDRQGGIRYGAETGEGTFRVEGDLFAVHRVTSEPAEIATLLAPVAPSNILCIGLNYRAHAEETNSKIPNYPVLFMKGTATLQHPGAPIELPVHLASERVDYEGELAIVLGYTCANDVSARDWQKEKSGGQFCRGKGFDTFCPLGPVLVTPDEVPDPNQLRIRTLVNDEVLQDSTTADMIFDAPTLIEFLSGSTTLLPGTVILTGTPPGVGMARTPPRFLKPGDIVTVEIEKIGRLVNPVILERV